MKDSICFIACGLIIGFFLPFLFLFPNSQFFLSERQDDIHQKRLAQSKQYSENIYEDAIAKKLYEEVRLLCWIMTQPENHKTKAIHIKRTWGSRCNKLLFMSSQKDPDIEIVALPVGEGRENLWDKTKRAFEYIYRHHFDDYDWFMKADDDSFAVPENIRFMLSQYQPQTSLYFGSRFVTETLPGGYMAGGGYILSKAALKKLVTKNLQNKTICSFQNYGNEDWELGKCLTNSAIFVDERDDNHQKRFFPTGVEDHFRQEFNMEYWYSQYQYYQVPQGNLSCCSDTPAAFHYISPQEMYSLDFLIMHVHPFGLDKNLTEELPKKIKLEQIIKAADAESLSPNYRKHEILHDIDSKENYRRRRIGLDMFCDKVRLLFNINVKELFHFILGAVIGFTLPLIIFYTGSLKFAPRTESFTNIAECKLYNDSLSQKLFKEVKLLCWVMTSPETHQSKAIHIKRTWGKRCNKLLFMSSQLDKNLETIALPVKEGRSFLWDKTKRSFEYVHKHHFKDYDWFLKADDDNFVIPENIRFMLSSYKPQTALYFGHRYAIKGLPEGYMAGGGYILSKGALKKLVTNILLDERFCSQNQSGIEDWEMGRCLAHSAIFTDERDEFDQKRFFPAGLNDHLKPTKDMEYWYDRSQYYEVPQGNLSCCSDIPIAFHYVKPSEMYLLDYFLTKVHPFGISKEIRKDKLPRKPTLNEIMTSADVESPSKNYHKHSIFHKIDVSETIK